MDELLIDDKKYVSSKRAAKITGYAKDYIGQLCREGRVPARLVGRSWYVLESAIQDHRFGAPGVAEEKAEKPVEPEEPVSTWESPRYEAATPPPLPLMEDLHSAVEEASVLAEAAAEEEKEEEPSLQQSWQHWFDQIAEIEPVRKQEEEAPEALPIEEEESREPEDEERGTEIRINTVYELPPEALLPQSSEIAEERMRERAPRPARSVRTVYAVLQLFVLIFAVGSASLAVIGSGYLDTYVNSFSQASAITGIQRINK